MKAARPTWCAHSKIWCADAAFADGTPAYFDSPVTELRSLHTIALNARVADRDASLKHPLAAGADRIGKGVASWLLDVSDTLLQVCD